MNSKAQISVMAIFPHVPGWGTASILGSGRCTFLELWLQQKGEVDSFLVLLEAAASGRPPGGEHLPENKSRINSRTERGSRRGF